MDSLGVSRLGSPKASLANSVYQSGDWSCGGARPKKKKTSEKLLVARSIKWLGTACGLEVFEISSIAQRIYVLLQFLNRELIHCGLAPPQFIHRIIFFVSKQRERIRIRFLNSVSLRTANFFQCIHFMHRSNTRFSKNSFAAL